jgi:hypothetical protein
LIDSSGRTLENQFRSLGLEVQAEMVMTKTGPEIIVLPEKRWWNMIVKNMSGRRTRNTKLAGK